jgi:hypothetical protein
MITWGRIIWPIGLAGAALYFLAFELTALFTNPANTLSDFTWYEFGLKQLKGMPVHYTLAWVLSLVAWWLFVGVITWHIWFTAHPVTGK